MKNDDHDSYLFHRWNNNKSNNKNNVDCFPRQDMQPVPVPDIISSKEQQQQRKNNKQGIQQRAKHKWTTTTKKNTHGHLQRAKYKWKITTNTRMTTSTKKKYQRLMNRKNNTPTKNTTTSHVFRRFIILRPTTTNKNIEQEQRQRPTCKQNPNLFGDHPT